MRSTDRGAAGEVGLAGTAGQHNSGASVDDHGTGSKQADEPVRGRGKAPATLRLIEACQEILREIQPATVRAVCYRLFTMGLIPDMSKNSTKVSTQLVWAREQCQILEWLVDETREAERMGTGSDSDAIIRAAVNGYRRDYWQDQPYRVEVWSEKGTVRGTVAPVLDELGVTFRVMHGFASATTINTIADESIADPRPFIALYIGDFDPSGMFMSEVDLPDRVGSLRRRGDDQADRATASRSGRPAALRRCDQERRCAPRLVPEAVRQAVLGSWTRCRQTCSESGCASTSSGTSTTTHGIARSRSKRPRPNPCTSSTPRKRCNRPPRNTRRAGDERRHLHRLRRDVYREPAERWKVRCLSCWRATKEPRTSDPDESLRWYRKGFKAGREAALSEDRDGCATIDAERVRMLLQLAHPDKHGGALATSGLPAARPSETGVRMSATFRTARANDLLECAICAAVPVAAVAEYRPHRLTLAGKQRTYVYGLCAECYAEVSEPKPPGRRRWPRSSGTSSTGAANRPPWEKR